MRPKKNNLCTLYLWCNVGDTQNKIITYIITNTSEIYTIYDVRHQDFYTAHYR